MFRIKDSNWLNNPDIVLHETWILIGGNMSCTKFLSCTLKYSMYSNAMEQSCVTEAEQIICMGLRIYSVGDAGNLFPCLFQVILILYFLHSISYEQNK